MHPPSGIPNNQRNLEAINSLLARVRQLDDSARARLAAMLDDEMDLPYLDMMEREYAQFFRQVAPDRANHLRSRFVRALNQQRAYLIDLVRNELQNEDEEQLPLLDSPFEESE